MSDGRNLDTHLFICTNFREKEGSCSQKGSVELREKVKKMCQDPARGWHGRIRVNTAGCLGRCEEGITAVLYPQAQWMTRLTTESADVLEKAIASVLNQP
jgi:(2Fe-2S) ferredoxin